MADPLRSARDRWIAFWRLWRLTLRENAHRGDTEAHALLFRLCTHSDDAIWLRFCHLVTRPSRDRLATPLEIRRLYRRPLERRATS